MRNCSKMMSLSVLVLTLFAVGCVTGEPKALDLNARLTSLEAVSKREPNAEYEVDPPDAISLEFMNQPDLSRSVVLRQDGTVTLPYVGDVRVAGMTTKEISEQLEKLYVKYYKQPQVSVSVSAFRSKHIYVYGEVGRRGTQSYTGFQTVADVIGAAGGITRRAAPGRVKVIRGDPEEPDIFNVDLLRVVYFGHTEQDVSLAENDVVYVPPSVLAWVGYRIDELLFPFRGIIGLGTTVESLETLGESD